MAKKKKYSTKQFGTKRGNPNRHVSGSSKSPLSIQTHESLQLLHVDLSKLEPPSQSYMADCFAFGSFLGYSDLYFGTRKPGQKKSELMNSVVIRMSKQIIKEAIIEGHKEFYEKLFERSPVSEKHQIEFEFNLESQFPLEKSIFFSANYLYASRSLGMGEFMFYKISPGFVHKLVTGKEAIVAKDSTGIEAALQIEINDNLMSYIYHILVKGYDVT